MSEMTATRMGSPVRLLTLAALAAAVGGGGVLPLVDDEGARTGCTCGGVPTAASSARSFLAPRAALRAVRLPGSSLRDDPSRSSSSGSYAWNGRALHAGVGGRADRHARCCSRCSASRSSGSSRSRSRCSRCGGSGGTTSRTRATARSIFGSWFAARRQVRVPLGGGADRRRARAAALGGAGGSRRRRLRRARDRCSRSSRPTSIPDTHPLRDPELRAAAAQIAERGGRHGVPIRVEDVDTEDAERVHGRARPLAEGLPLELAPRRPVHATARSRS